MNSSKPVYLQRQKPFYIMLVLNFRACRYVINWGDGNIQSLPAKPASPKEVSHTYTSSGLFYIHVTLCAKSQGCDERLLSAPVPRVLPAAKD